MTITEKTLKELIESAKQPENEDTVIRLLDNLDNVESGILAAEAEPFRQLLESWSEDITRSDDKALLCVKLAERNVLDTEDFRSALHLAVRKLLPPYLASGSVIKAIGAKDPSVSVRDVAQRLRKLQHLRSTALVYHQETKQWGKINGIDKVTGTIAVTALMGNSVSSVPIASAVVSSCFFNTTPEFLNLLYPDRHRLLPAAEYRRLFQQNTLSEIFPQKIREIVFNLMVPGCMTPEDFDAWWNAEAAPAAPAAGRLFADSRSVLELYTRLSETEEKIGPLGEEDAAKLAKLFARLRQEMAPKDVSRLMECIAILSEPETDAALLTLMFQPLRGKAPFWPKEITEKTPLSALENWGRLSVKLLPAFIKASSLLYTQQEMAVFATLLPLRCVGLILATLPKDAVMETLLKVKNPSADLLLWIWKNRSTVSPRLADEVDMAHVVSAISVERLPKEWTAAQRELKKYVFEKEDFQKFLIQNACGDIPSIISAIQRCRSLQGGERQSVMVKLGRHSDELRAYIEAGEGRRMMGNQAQTPVQAPVTSVKSHRRLAAELENLINVQIPENAAAVALARSYGDLRENAEYDAAKEKRAFLHRRRSELEKTLGFIQSTDFKDVVLDGHVAVGCVVRLASASGETREFSLLGAWDGDPEKNRISYKTRIGEAVLGRKVGDSVEIPGEGSFTVKEILPLPEELRKELADEA